MKNAPMVAMVVLTGLSASQSAFSQSARDVWRTLVPAKLAARPEFDFVPNDAALPNVLLYGDSISMGYTVRVRDQLRGKANVYRLHTNGNHSGKFIGLMSEMHQAMRSEPLDFPWTWQWDVIHFNVGLHDLKYVLDGKKDKQNGEQVSSVEAYKTNLRAIVAHLRELAPNARLIFATTTPVPEGESGRVAGDAKRYNAAAAEVLADHPDVAINDLYSLVRPDHSRWWTRPGNVHFNQAGNQALGDRVAQSITEALSSPR